MRIILFIVFLSFAQVSFSQHLSEVGLGWSENMVNTVVFRKNSIVTHKRTQYISYYNAEGYVVLGKRKINTDDWEIKQTQYKGNIRDAHNSISIIVDGDGYLHVSWDHHGHPLRYSKSVEPGSLELTEKLSMIKGKNEKNVTYPEFYKLENGDLLFMYRDGASGRGNIVLNKYDTKNKTWSRIHDNLINGEGKRNAYWQAVVDHKGIFHLSWVWRESADVASNHDMCYAKSEDGGITWKTSKDENYIMPINAANSEYIVRIPQKSELINSTSMTTNQKGFPYIVSYWRPEDSLIPQYQLIAFDGKNWNVTQVSNRKTPFSLSGVGTKRIPISRPQVVTHRKHTWVITRDEERGNKASVYETEDLEKGIWTLTDLTSFSLDQWEPSIDTELWKNRKKLHVFVQQTGQGDGETTQKMAPTMVNVLEYID
jgi:hypothetical protein